MKRNNIKLLTDEEFDIMVNKYLFSIIDNNIAVKINGTNKVTIHEGIKPFHINAKGLRKVCFSQDAIDIWKSLNETELISLLAVQQAVNKLIMTFQEVTQENVQKILSGMDIKIK